MKVKIIASWNYIVSTVNNDYFEFYWLSFDTNVQLKYFSQFISPTTPGVPSVILTVTLFKEY